MSRNVHSRWQFPNSKLQFLKRSFKIATTETMTHSQISASKNSRIPKLQLSHCKIATPETMPYSKISACVFQIEVPALQNCNSRNKDLCKNNTNKNVLLSNGMNGGANYFTFVRKQANTHLLLTAVMKEVESCKCQQLLGMDMNPPLPQPATQLIQIRMPCHHLGNRCCCSC